MQLSFSLNSLLAVSFDRCSPPAENLHHPWCSHLSPHYNSSGKDNYASDEGLFRLFQSSSSLSDTMVKGHYLQDSCLSNPKSIAQHQRELKAQLTVVESCLTAQRSVLVLVLVGHRGERISTDPTALQSAVQKVWKVQLCVLLYS